MTKKIGFREAVNAKCKDCIYDEHSGLGNWRQQVEACPMKDCPLYDLRPISKPHKQSTGAIPDGLAKWQIEQAKSSNDKYKGL